MLYHCKLTYLSYIASLNIFIKDFCVDFIAFVHKQPVTKRIQGQGRTWRTEHENAKYNSIPQPISLLINCCTAIIANIPDEGLRRLHPRKVMGILGSLSPEASVAVRSPELKSLPLVSYQTTDILFFYRLAFWLAWFLRLYRA